MKPDVLPVEKSKAVTGERPAVASNACPVLLAFARELWEAITWRNPDTIADLIYGTEASAETQRHRAYLLADAAFRELAPLAMEVAGWSDLADEMRALGKIHDLTSAKLAVVSRAVDSATERGDATAETHPAARGPLDGAHMSAAIAAELARDAVASCEDDQRHAAEYAGRCVGEAILACKAIRIDISPVREAALRALERAIAIKDAT